VSVLVFFVMFFLPPFVVSWPLVHFTNALIKGPEQRHTDRRAKQFRERLAFCESAEICPHNMSVLTCRFEGRTECAAQLREKILRYEFADLILPSGRRCGLTDNGEWLTSAALTVALTLLLLGVVIGP
jgi:hypothetical protein